MKEMENNLLYFILQCLASSKIRIQIFRQEY